LQFAFHFAVFSSINVFRKPRPILIKFVIIKSGTLIYVLATVKKDVPQQAVVPSLKQYVLLVVS